MIDIRPYCEGFSPGSPVFPNLLTKLHLLDPVRS